MSRYYRPFLPFTAALMVGILAGAFWPGYRPWACGTAGIAFTILLICIGRRKECTTVPILFFAGLGYLLIQPWTAPVLTDQHICRYADNTSYMISGVVDTPVFFSGFRQKFTLRADHLGGGPMPLKVSGRVRVSVAAAGQPITAGDRISFVGRLRSIRSFQNPGGFDYGRYMALKGIWVSASVKRNSLRVLSHPGLSGIRGIVEPAREGLSKHIERVCAVDRAGILKALVVGDKRGVTEEIRQVFQQAGVGHLLAISGLHVGIVATSAFFVFSYMLGFFPPLLYHAWTKRGAAGISILVVWGYGLLAGMSPSTLRATIMATAFLTGILLGRTQDTITSLSVAALVILILDPPALFSISFQLSFIAVIAIVIGSSIFRPEKGPLSRLWRHAKNRFFQFLLVSLFAILGTMPLTLFYFHEMSTIGLVSNIIFIPLLGFGVVPLALISACLMPISMPLSVLGFKCCGSVVFLALTWMRWMAAWPFATTHLVTPSPFEIYIFYGMLILAVRGVYCRRQQHATPAVKLTDPGPAIGIMEKKISSIVFALLLVALVADSFYWAHQRFWHGDLKVTVIDVGHGNATLLELPGGGNMLIDGGGFSDNSVFDVGENVVAPLLWRKKIRTIDTVVLSHPNSDHLNGLIFVLNNFDVKQIWTNGEVSDTHGYKEFMAAIGTRRIEMPAYQDLPPHRMVNGVIISLLYPPYDFLRQQTASCDSNNNSLVLKVSFGDVDFLVPGDIMAVGEKALVHTARDSLRSEVLLASHHGSRTSSTMPFLRQVKPELIIVSAGNVSPGVFPHPEVMKRYHQVGARVLITNDHGAVSLATNGHRLWVTTTAAPSETICLSL